MDEEHLDDLLQEYGQYQRERARRSIGDAEGAALQVLWRMSKRAAIPAGAVILIAFGIFELWPSKPGAPAGMHEARAELAEIANQSDMRPRCDLRRRADDLYEKHRDMPDAALVAARVTYACAGPQAAIELLNVALEKSASPKLLRLLLNEMRPPPGGQRSGVELVDFRDISPEGRADACYLLSLATLDDARALDYVAEAVALDPTNTLAWSRLAYLYFGSNRLDDAYAAAEKLVKLGQDNDEWRNLRVMVRLRQGRFDEAIRICQNMPMSDDVDLCSNLGHAYLQLGRCDQALALYEKALTFVSNPGDQPWHLYRIAPVLWMLGKPDQAIQTCNDFQRLGGHWYYAGVRAILMLRELGRDDDATKLLGEMIADPGTDPWLHTILTCLAGTITPDELVKSAADAWAASPEPSNKEHLCEAYYYAGEVCLLHGEREKTEQLFRKCVETDVRFDLDDPAFVPMNEYVLARWRLDQLGMDSGPTSQPADQ